MGFSVDFCWFFEFGWFFLVCLNFGCFEILKLVSGGCWVLEFICYDFIVVVVLF